MQADLLDVLTRLASASNIRCMRVTPPFDGLDQFDYGLRKALDPYFDWQEFGSLLLQSTHRGRQQPAGRQAAVRTENGRFAPLSVIFVLTTKQKWKIINTV